MSVLQRQKKSMKGCPRDIHILADGSSSKWIRVQDIDWMLLQRVKIERKGNEEHTTHRTETRISEEEKSIDA